MEENPFYGLNSTLSVGNIRGLLPRYAWTKTFVFFLTIDRESTDRCFLYACYGNPQLGEELLTLAQRMQDVTLLLEAHRALGTSLFYLGELALGRAHLEQAITLYDPQQHRSLAFRIGQDPGVVCGGFAAWALGVLGYPDQARQRSYDTYTLAQELAHPFSLAYALDFVARIHQLRREGQLTQQWAEALLMLAREQGFTQRLATGTILLGWALTAQGQKAEGVDQVRQGLAAFRATGAELARPYYLALLAEAYAKVGQQEDGLTLLAKALATVHKTGERLWEAELHRLKGELLLPLSAEKHAEAEACFQQALEVARHQQATSLELRAAMSLARLWQQQSRRAEARELLAPVYGWFTEGFGTADLQEAKAGDFCISPRKGIFQHPTASVGVTGTCDNACTIASMSMASGALRNS